MTGCIFCYFPEDLNTSRRYWQGQIGLYTNKNRKKKIHSAKSAAFLTFFCGYLTLPLQRRPQRELA